MWHLWYRGDFDSISVLVHKDGHLRIGFRLLFLSQVSNSLAIDTPSIIAEEFYTNFSQLSAVRVKRVCPRLVKVGRYVFTIVKLAYPKITHKECQDLFNESYFIEIYGSEGHPRDDLVFRKQVFMSNLKVSNVCISDALCCSGD